MILAGGGGQQKCPIHLTHQGQGTMDYVKAAHSLYLVKGACIFRLFFAFSKLDIDRPAAARLSFSPLHVSNRRRSDVLDWPLSPRTKKSQIVYMYVQPLHL